MPNMKRRDRVRVIHWKLTALSQAARPPMNGFVWVTGGQLTLGLNLNCHTNYSLVQQSVHKEGLLQRNFESTYYYTIMI